MAAKKKAAKAKARKAATRKKVLAIPRGYGDLTIALVFKDARPALDWYRKVFGARITTRMDMPDGKIMHAEMKIGSSLFMLGDEAPDRGISSAESLGGASASVMLYTKDCDAVYARAVAAGAKPAMPPMDMFWGDRYGQVVDPFGHRWAIATHLKDLTPKQLAAATAEAVKMMAQGLPPTA